MKGIALPVSRREAFWLGAILSVALVLRVVALGSGLWYDEIDTLVHHVRRPVAQLITSYPSLNDHVLFTLEAKASIAAFGESVVALRLPALVFGVGSIWALWLLARQVAPVRAALFSAALLAVSYHHVWFSQNARGYTGLLFFGLLGTYFLLRASRTGSWWSWSAYGVAGALAVYTHLTGASLLAAHAVVIAGALALRSIADRGREQLSGLHGWGPPYAFTLAALLSLLLYAPMLRSMIETFTTLSAPAAPAAAAAIAEWKSPVWTVLEVVRSLGPVLGTALPVAVAILIAGIAGMRGIAALVPAILFTHVLLTLGVLLAGHFRIWPRYFFIDIGFICLCLVSGVFVIGQWIARAVARAGRSADAATIGSVLAVSVIATSLVLLPRNYLYPKQDFVGARDYVDRNRKEPSAVATLGLASMPFSDYYAPQWTPVASLAELERLGAGRREVWLVYAFPAVTERRYADLLNAIRPRFALVNRLPGTLGGGDVIVLRSIDPQ